MKIKKIEVWNFAPTFKDGPFVQSYVTQDAAYGRILRVLTEEGTQGLGEIVFAPIMTAQERQQRILDEHDYLTPLIGQDIESLAELSENFREHGKTWCGIAFGLETAYLDILARCEKRSMTDLLGGSMCDFVNGYHSISKRTCAEIREQLVIADPVNATQKQQLFAE